MIIAQAVLFLSTFVLFFFEQISLSGSNPNKEEVFWLFLPAIWLQIHVCMGYVFKRKSMV